MLVSLWGLGVLQGETGVRSIRRAANENAIPTSTAKKLQVAGRWTTGPRPEWCTTPGLPERPGVVGLEIARGDAACWTLGIFATVGAGLKTWARF